MNKFRQNVLPVIAALIWGTAFSAQSICAKNGMGAFTLNALRSIVAAITLFIVVIILGRKSLKDQLHDKLYVKNLVLGGACVGFALFAASNLQQFGIEGTESGKSGFITVLYIVLVPLLRAFTGKRPQLNVIISVVIALVGMYFMCIDPSKGFAISKYDFFVLLCAFAFSFHILWVDHFTKKVDCIQLSMMQFVFCAVFSSIGMFTFDKPSFQIISASLPGVLYIGIFSSGVAYTLQLVAQKGSDPTVVSLLLSLESVFAILSGAIFLNEVLLPREYIGCAIMFIAVILAQLPMKKRSKQ